MFFLFSVLFMAGIAVKILDGDIDGGAKKNCPAKKKVFLFIYFCTPL